LVFCNAGNLVLQVLHLAFSVLFLVSADAAMDNLVERILRVLFMEDVLLAVFPVREIG